MKIGIILASFAAGCEYSEHPQHAKCMSDCTSEMAECSKQCEPEDAQCQSECARDLITCENDCPCCTKSTWATCPFMGKPTELKTPQIVQFECSNRDDEVFISTQLSYMPTKSPKFAEFAGGQEHGFHVHGTGIIADENGDIDCGLTGGHFTKDGQAHSDPTNDSRHFGDLGNIWRDESGVMDIEIFDSVISLDRNKESYIGGRALVLHELPDDFTGASGNAGSRLGCCVINHDEN